MSFPLQRNSSATRLRGFKSPRSHERQLKPLKINTLFSKDKFSTHITQSAHATASRYGSLRRVDNMAIFQRVATSISIYKVARYFWKEVEEDETHPYDDKLSRRNDFEEAQAQLSELIDGMDGLPPASRQQLLILYYEVQCEELGMRLTPRSVERKRSYSNYDSPSSSDEDDAPPFRFGGDLLEEEAESP